MAKTFINIFRRPLYLFITLIVFVIILVFAAIAPNIDLIISVYSNFGFSASLETIGTLLGSLKTNFTVFSLIMTILIALFFGINFSLFVFYFKKYSKIKKSSTSGAKTSIFGLLIGALGVGCASCGSLVVTSFLSLVGLGGLFQWLPFGGQEFTFLGVMMLIVSTYFLLKKIYGPMTCSV